MRNSTHCKSSGWSYCRALTLSTHRCIALAALRTLHFRAHPQPRTSATTPHAFLRQLKNPGYTVPPPGVATVHRSSTKSGRHKSQPRAGQDIELVTQVSLDRWPRFAQQALAWGGPVSVAVYIPCPLDHPLAGAYQDYLQVLAGNLRNQMAVNSAASNNSRVASAAEAEADGLPQCHLTVSVVHSLRLAREGALVLSGVIPPPQFHENEQEGCNEQLYPINALRNAALRAATCSHVWLVDGDFIPSCGLREALLQPMAGAYVNINSRSSPNGSSSSSESTICDHISSYNLLDLSDSYARPVMWVVPAFELCSVSVNGDVDGGGGGTTANLKAAGVKGIITADQAPPLPIAATEVPDSQVVDVPRTFEQLYAVANGRRGSGVPKDAPKGPGSKPCDKAADAHSSTGAATKPPTELRPFHCGRYPQPVASIDYGCWWAASLGSEMEPSEATLDGNTVPVGRSLESTDGGNKISEAVAGLEGPYWITVPYHEYFEPYGIVRRDQVPLYDERFRGYGLNKVQHVYHMWAAGFQFRVLIKHFCVTVPHTRSLSYRAVFGTAADPRQRLRVEQLYEQFKQEMYNKYGLRYMAPQS
ncbi:hypothetical protein Vretimale_10130 [Volvox reticuliferus]|uniref:Uncharacterized protein n=1 Tax=Volvox reticuliferus TaxID=1737510 RepID=A0A8J4GEP2_9CHLO|nr:hypothetical protein Vretimale_10130 [Volvox reticuliferus]